MRDFTTVLLSLVCISDGRRIQHGERETQLPEAAELRKRETSLHGGLHNPLKALALLAGSGHTEAFHTGRSLQRLPSKRALLSMQEQPAQDEVQVAASSTTSPKLDIPRTDYTKIEASRTMDEFIKTIPNPFDSPNQAESKNPDAESKKSAEDPAKKATTSSSPRMFQSFARLVTPDFITAPSTPYRVTQEQAKKQVDELRDKILRKGLGQFLKFIRGREEKKQELLDALQRGAGEAEVVDKFSQLAELYREPEPVKSDKLSGDWYMAWTTSVSIAGKNRPWWLRAVEAPLQSLNIAEGTGRNSELLSPLKVPSAVEIELTPKPDGRGCKAVFTKFIVGPLALEGPRLSGVLDVAYLDEEMRLALGDKGNRFVLLRNKTKADELWGVSQQLP